MRKPTRDLATGPTRFEHRASGQFAVAELGDAGAAIVVVVADVDHAGMEPIPRARAPPLLALTATVPTGPSSLTASPARLRAPRSFRPGHGRPPVHDHRTRCVFRGETAFACNYPDHNGRTATATNPSTAEPDRQSQRRP
jgi:hypothetical protein